MACGGEAGHVGADLSQDHLGGAVAHPRDADQQRHRRFMRVQQLLDRLGELVDGGIGLVDASEHGPAQQAVVGIEPSGQGIGQFGDLGPHPALGHLGQHRRVTLAGDEGVDHLPS